MEDKRLYSPNYIKKIIEKYDFKFSKSLGQNFLIDGNIVRNIVASADIDEDDCVLEIGPGIGTMTEELGLNSKKVVAVELDDSLLPVLDETLGKYDNIEIIHGDILKVDLDSIIEEKLEGGPIKVVANLPYYVTTPILGKLIEENHNIESITVMVQKEIAERMVAEAGSKDYGALSVFINFYTEPEIKFIVPNTVFMPRPKVDSAIISLKIKKDLDTTERESFFNIVKGSFATRRKTLLNSLSNYKLYDLDKADIRRGIEGAGIDPKTRAEDLSIEEFIRLNDSFLELMDNGKGEINE